MRRWFFEALCVLAFAAPIGAACLHAWPFVTSRPLPAVLDTEAALIAAVTLLLSTGLTMLMSVRLQTRR